MTDVMVRDGIQLWCSIMFLVGFIMLFEGMLFIYMKWIRRKFDYSFSSFFGRFDVKEFLAFYLVLVPLLVFVVSGFLSYVFHSIF